MPVSHPSCAPTQIGRVTDTDRGHHRRLVTPANTEAVPPVGSPRELREFSQQQDFIPLSQTLAWNKPTPRRRLVGEG